MKYTKMNKKINPSLIFALVSALSVIITNAQNTLIDASFDGVANDTNNTFQIISNTQGNGSGASWNQTTGLITQGTTTASTAGAVSTTPIDVPADSVVLTAVVQAGSGSISHNGIFIGFQQAAGGADTGGDLWNNQAPSFGLVINGTNNRSPNLTVAPGGNEPTNGSFQDTSPSFGVTTNASINDGFTVTMTITSAGWEFNIIGLETSGSVAITGGSGTWSDLPFDFSDFSNAMRVAVTAQGAGGTLDLASITVLDGGDTDEDGIPDSWEDANGLNKNNPDDAALDNDSNGGPDGLTNLQEYITGTDPQDSDTDDDGLNDGDEVNGTQNPWSNGILGSTPGDPTDPLNPNSDGDDDNDGLEITNGTDPNLGALALGQSFPFIDTDGDSYSDEAEVAFGSDPADENDCPDHTPLAAKPNIVIIYADDLGITDMSAYGDFYGTPSPALTPRMNSLATEGVMFMQAHSSNAVCTPSRYALLTGKYNWREFTGITGNWGGQIAGQELPRPSDITIAEFLKTESYDTVAFGKWHLGGKYFDTSGARITSSTNPNDESVVDWEHLVENHAVDNGFDIFRGLASSINFGPYVQLEGNRMQFWDTTLNGGAGAFRDALNSDTFQYLTTGQLNSTVVGTKGSRACLGDPSYKQIDAGPIMIGMVEEYFSDRVTTGDTDPFFAYVSLYSPHQPHAITPPFQTSDTANGFYYADFMREVDHRIGRVLDAIDNNGFKNNTIVILTSDNGTENTAMVEGFTNGKDSNGPLRGNKRDVWEGGTRVPFVVRWPGQAAAGIKVSDPIWQGDIFASVAAFLNTELPNTTAPDGESFLNLIRGQQKPEKNRREVIAMASIRDDLGIKTINGWKFIDATGGGNNNSWDSSNEKITNSTGVNQGSPKQLFRLNYDIGEDNNLISSLTSDSSIRAELTHLTGEELLSTLDTLRTTNSTVMYTRAPDNDADLIPNAYEIAHSLDPNSPKDANIDSDGDEQTNLQEFNAGTSASDASDFFRITSIANKATEVDLTVPTGTGRTYTAFWSLDLITWVEATTRLGTGAPITITLDKTTIDNADNISGNLDRVFFRVQVDQL